MRNPRPETPIILSSATEMIGRVQRKETSVKELLQAHLDRIDELEPKVGAWAFLDPELALEAAADIDRSISEGFFRGTLFGLPVGVKDVFNTFDMPTAMGSPLWEGFTPGNDARVVHYLRMRGAVFPGKTVTAEFAVHAPGKTVNPHNPEYSPGTSSSGSAAAVACQMVPVALGTQTAGSICRPASYCGVYGFKPSFGLIPRTGVLKTTDTLDTIGGFSRTPEDLRLLFDVIRVRGLNFPILQATLDDPSRQDRGSRPWRVGILPSFNRKFSQPYAYEALMSLVETLGLEKDVALVEKDLPAEFHEAHDIHATIYDKSLSYYFKREFGSKGFISDIIGGMIERGNAITLDEFDRAIEMQKALSARLDQCFEEYDVILTLTTQGIAPKLTEPDKPDTCLVWTLCGAPAVSVPVFKGPDGMPFGVQIVARRYNDYLLLKFADFLDDLTGRSRSGSPPGAC